MPQNSENLQSVQSTFRHPLVRHYTINHMWASRSYTLNVTCRIRYVLWFRVKRLRYFVRAYKVGKVPPA